MRIGTKVYPAGHTYVMGILNVTPDSFSDGGKFTIIDNALFRVAQMAGEGMDVLDIGGESTRPGHTQISDQEEIDRVCPVIEAVKARFDLPISLDTYKSEVAKAGIAAGAHLINDIWGLKYDPAMASVIASAEVSCCLMHNRHNQNYVDLMGDIISDLQESLSLAEQAGISRERILLDPGIGFAKTPEQNLEVLKYLQELQGLNLPVLLGASRKSVIGHALDLPTDQRLEGTLVTTVLAVQAGCRFVRVHDIKENVRAIRMTEAILGR